MELVIAKPDENSVHYVVKWRMHIISLTASMYDSIEALKNELDITEKNMDDTVLKHYQSWYPQIKECYHEDPQKLMLGNILDNI
jgi:hypothetical protein